MYHGWRLLRLKGNELLWLHHWRWDDLGGNNNLYYAFGMGEELVGILNCIWDLGFGIWDSSIRYHSLHVFCFLYSFYIDIPLKVAGGVEGLCVLCVNLCKPRKSEIGAISTYQIRAYICCRWIFLYLTLPLDSPPFSVEGR